MSKGKKRINPETGKPFIKGEIREDGAIFEKYTNRVRKKDGLFMEQWNVSGRTNGSKRINQDTGEPFKHGDIDSNGNMFRGYDVNRVRADGTYTELWIKKETLEKRLEKQAKAVKRINPLTNEPFVVGDTRKEDDKIFFTYREKAKEDGYKAEEWWSPDEYHRKRIAKNINSKKSLCKKRNIPFDLSIDYAIEIFPKDNLCPVFGSKMNWGGEGSDNQDSPSIDRIIPSKGYVKGNVVWMSFRANSIKRDASPKELEKVFKWLKKEMEKRK